MSLWPRQIYGQWGGPVLTFIYIARSTYTPRKFSVLIWAPGLCFIFQNHPLLCSLINKTKPQKSIPEGLRMVQLLARRGRSPGTCSTGLCVGAWVWTNTAPQSVGSGGTGPGARKPGSPRWPGLHYKARMRPVSAWPVPSGLGAPTARSRPDEAVCTAPSSAAQTFRAPATRPHAFLRHFHLLSTPMFRICLPHWSTAESWSHIISA